MTALNELEIKVDLSKEQFGREVPFGIFAQLRKKAPLYWYEPEAYWVVSTYDLLGQINRDPIRFSSSLGPGPQLGQRPYDHDLTILNMDPPKHSVYRRLVNKMFTPHRVQEQETKARTLARELIAQFVDSGGGDFVTQVAALLPLRVIGAMMGIEREDESAILRRTNSEIGGSDPEYAPASEEERETFHREAIEYYDRLIDEHRNCPRGDLIDNLLEARVEGEPLNQAQLRAWIGVYIGGGAETTRHLIAHGLTALLDWPDERQKVIDGIDLDPVVEEMFRWITPVMQHSRWPTEPVEFDGQTIEPGQRTTLWMVSANRDIAAFEDPDRFDVTRVANRHDSLGAGGPHFCLGAGLARLECRVVFEELRPYLGRIALDGLPERVQNTMFNGLKHLPIVVDTKQ